MQEHAPSPELLRALVKTKMPFGRYQGRPLHELPEAYLVWMQRQGFPRGKLGQELALMLEIKHNGLLSLLAPLIDEAKHER